MTWFQLIAVEIPVFIIAFVMARDISAAWPASRVCTSCCNSSFSSGQWDDATTGSRPSWSG